MATMIDDIKLTVADYAIDKASEMEIVKLQRYFLREYCAWLPFRAIGEATGCTHHTTVMQSINEVRSAYNLRRMIKPIKRILDMKFFGKVAA